MFNFKIMNRALNDAELKEAFRMLYYITNKCSLKNSNSVDIYDAEFELALKISHSTTKRLTRKLEDRGYLIKTINGTSENKLANTYTLVEVNDTPTDSLCNEIKNESKNEFKNDPLKNNNKINKNNNIFLSNNINIPDTEIDNINIDKTDEVFLSNFMKVDNINTDNSDVESENLKIEIRNMNKENVMNEMNNINNSNKSLEDILTEQSDEFNDIIQFMNNSVEDTDEADTSDNSKNLSVEEQERYSRLFDKCKSQIEIWSKTHDYACISIFDAYYKTIQSMNDEHLITPKQWNTAKRYLFERFINLRNGYNNYIQKKNKTISSNGISECNNPQPPRPEENENKAVLGHENSSDIQTINQSKETQQDANKRAKMAIVERECKAQNKQFNFDTLEMIINYINSYVESKEEKEEWINRYFDGIKHQIPSYIEAMKKKALSKISPYDYVI